MNEQKKNRDLPAEVQLKALFELADLRALLQVVLQNQALLMARLDGRDLEEVREEVQERYATLQNEYLNDMQDWLDDDYDA